MKDITRLERPGVLGWLHAPAGKTRGAMALTHGAGGNCDAPLLVAVAVAFAGAGHAVLRYDLPFRQARKAGGPSGSAKRDQEGIRAAAAVLRQEVPGVPVYLAGHSYGGRQSSMVAAENPEIAAALLLLSYPLHPPGQPEKRRVEHFPALRVPVLFAHGTRDAFGSVAELEEAMASIPARAEIRVVEGAQHGLPVKTAGQVADWFAAFVESIQ